jgi:hypothetical protein
MPPTAGVRKEGSDDLPAKISAEPGYRLETPISENLPTSGSQTTET